MTPAELRTWRTSHNLTIPELSRLLDVGESTLKRWENGTSRIPARVAILLPRLQKSELNAVRRETERAAVRKRKGPQDHRPDREGRGVDLGALPHHRVHRHGSIPGEHLCRMRPGDMAPESQERQNRLRQARP